MPSKLKSSWVTFVDDPKQPKKPKPKLTAAEKAAEKESLARTVKALMDLDLGNTPVPPPAKPKRVKPTGANLKQAVLDDDYVLACQLVEAGADVNAEWPNRCTPLHYASGKGEAALVRLLLDKGAKIDHQDGPSGYAAIHYAALSDSDTVLRILIERGAQLDIRSKNGETALFEATADNKPDNVKLLIDSGADVDTKNYAGKGLVYAAAAEAHADMVELLLTYPAQSAARRDALEAQRKAAGEALAEATTVLQDRVAVSRPLVLKLPAPKA